MVVFFVKSNENTYRKQGSTNQIAQGPGQVTFTVGQGTNEQKSVFSVGQVSQIDNTQDAPYLSVFIQPNIIFRSIMVARGEVILSLQPVYTH